MEIFVFKRFQSVLFGLFGFDPEMTLSVIDPINLRYRNVIAAKKGTCEPVPRNSVTANKIAPSVLEVCNFILEDAGNDAANPVFSGALGRLGRQSAGVYIASVADLEVPVFLSR
jgi:hypothetical protein